ncbi:MAG TPA: glycosyltransferase family 39 protein [Capsulimonadaceae bacterium]|jgi:hypothetical protein
MNTAERQPKSEGDPTVLDRGHGVLLTVVLVIAAVVRVAGLKWGLPNDLHSFSYHPDESVVLMHSLPAFGGLDVVHGSFLPHFYNYGSLQLEIISFASSVASAYHAVGPINGEHGLDTAAFASMLLIARWITVVMGVGTVWATFAIGRRLWGPAVGLLAAATLALTPLHAQHSHFATVDVPATFWVTLSLLFAVRALPHPMRDGEKQSWWPLIVSGLFAGLATATKYNCALVIFAPLVAGHIRAWGVTIDGTRDMRHVARAAAATVSACVVALVTFLVTCPGAVLERERFLTDLAFEKDHVYLHPELYFQQTGPGFSYIVLHNLSAGMGWLALIAALMGVVYAVWRRERGDGLLGLFTLAYVVLISFAASRYARYEMPILPVLALWGARFVVDWGRTALTMRVTSTLYVAATLGSMAAITAWLIGPMTGVDPRDRTAADIIARNPAPATIGFATVPWFWTPALNPYFTLPGPGQWRKFASETKVPSRLVFDDSVPFNVDMLARDKPDLVLLSEYEYHDRLRLNDPAAVAFCAYLRQNYTTSWAEVRLPSTSAASILGMPVRELPHDMLYTNPITLTYRRNNPAR